MPPAQVPVTGVRGLMFIALSRNSWNLRVTSGLVKRSATCRPRGEGDVDLAVLDELADEEVAAGHASSWSASGRCLGDEHGALVVDVERSAGLLELISPSRLRR